MPDHFTCRISDSFNPISLLPTLQRSTLMSSQTATAVVPSSGGQLVQAQSTTVRRVSRNASGLSKQPAVPSPGRFKHPRIEDIAKRKAANSFTATNVQIVILNVAVLLASFYTSNWTSSWVDHLIQSAQLGDIGLSSSVILIFIRLVLVTNTYFALRPVLPYLGNLDAIKDIPLTPSQRVLLGLPPSQSNTPVSAKEGDYVTPPRYRRSSPAPFTGTTPSGASGRSISANYSTSPLSTSRYTVGFSPTPQQGSATPGNRASGTLFSSSSPLINKTLSTSHSLNEISSNADFTESTRSLLAGGTSTSSFSGSLRRSHTSRDRGRLQEPGTPSPSAREKVKMQPGLNYKWLYEKGMKVDKNGTIEY